MKRLLLLMMIMSCIWNKNINAQEDFYVLITKMPTTGYGYPGVIQPKYELFYTNTTISNLGLLGKVKSVKYDDGTIYEFNEKGSITKEVNVYEGNGGTSTKLYTYDKENRLIEFVHTGTELSEMNRKSSFNYLGEKVEATYISNGDTTFKTISPAEVNSKMYQVKRNAYGLISELNQVKLIYDGKKQLIELKRPKGTETRYYNENGTLSRIKYIESKHETNVSFRYDPKGKWVRETASKISFGKTNLISDNLIHFEFDAKGNWTKMDIKDNQNSRFSKTYNRSISYY